MSVAELHGYGTLLVMWEKAFLGREKVTYPVRHTSQEGLVEKVAMVAIGYPQTVFCKDCHKGG